MFTISLSSDNITYKPYFTSGRLRIYATLANALNASRQLLKSPIQKVTYARVHRKEDNSIVVTVRKTDKGFDQLPREEDKPSIASTSKIKTPITDLMTKEAKIQIIKKNHEEWKEKKKDNEEVVIEGDCCNNFSHHPTLSPDFSSFMADLIEDAIATADSQLLFKLELSLSQKGYSWYPKGNGHIGVEKTSMVIDLINKKEI